MHEHELFMRYVRGNIYYCINDFVDNDDSTITDEATGLTWTKYVVNRACAGGCAGLGRREKRGELPGP